MRGRIVLWGAYRRDVQAGSRRDRFASTVTPSSAEIEAGLVLAPHQKALLSRFFDLDAVSADGYVSFKPVRVGER